MKRIDRKAVYEKAAAFLQKYRVVLLVGLLGLLLLLLPSRSGKQEQTEQTAPTEEPTAETTGMEERLCEILSKVDGAGQVNVMLTLKAGESYVYQTDTTETGSGQGNGTVSVSTVVISEGSQKETPVLVQTVAPTYLGALVVAEGADSVQVCLNLKNAVSALTGLGLNKITVIKMAKP